MKIAFYTLGCKVNQYETQILAQYFGAEGFDLVEPSQEADIYVINSCTVTATGDQKTRQILRRFRRQNPRAIIALTGCMPQAFPKEAAILKEADIVAGSANRKGLLALVKQAMVTGERVVAITPHSKDEGFEQMQATGFTDKTRAFLKIQDGCRRFCAYCIIPTARGGLRSKAAADLLEETKQQVAAGFSEIVLVGINLSCYGQERGETLIHAVDLVCGVPGVERVRLGSLEPERLDLAVLERLATHPNFCPQFHLSLQSGCDQTLLRMNRHYTTADYAEIVKNIRQVFDNPAITTDVMAGFPGETEEEFAQTKTFLAGIGLAKAHVFAYSKREGTAAAIMPDQLLSGVKNQRAKELIQCTDLTRKQFLAGQVGRDCQVLFDQRQKTPWMGYSENYTPVFVASGENLAGKILPVTIIGLDETEEYCIAKLK